MSDHARVEELRTLLRTANRRRALEELAGSALPDSVRTALLPELVRLVAYRHADYDAAFAAFRRMSPAALDESLWREMVVYLDGSDSEPFLRFAQLLAELERRDDLHRLVDRAREFDDQDIREVVKDFG